MKFSLCLGVAALASTGLGCLLPEERDDTVMHTVVRRGGNTGTPIGTGDRFKGGSIAPRGLGTQPNTSFTTILNPAEILSGLKALSNTYGAKVFATPHKTFNGATVYGARVGGTGTGNAAYKVFFNGNIHARERGSADNILYFVSDLLYANKNNIGVSYGSKTYTAAQVKTALAAGIVFIPLSNPDGVAYDQATNSCWRKNRRPNSGGSYGVDLNRNFDFLWDFTKKFAPNVRSSVASTIETSETYHGTAAFSEAETKNIKWVFDKHSKVRWYIDLHSYSGDILYTWGSDTNQYEYPYMNFMNDTYDGVRGILSDKPGVGKGYGEYVEPTLARQNIDAARRTSLGLSAGGGRVYKAIQSCNLYPTSGTSDDYATTRHIVNPKKNLVHGFTVEFGFGGGDSCPFYPSVSIYNENIKATNAGFMEFLLAATDIGLE